MRKAFRWIGVSIGGLLGLLLLAGAGLYFVGRREFAERVKMPASPPHMTSDAATVARGRHLSEAVAGCAGCHGKDLGGQMFPTPAFLVTMGAPNLTSGEGGIGAKYQDEDWARALRHGVGVDGRKLIIMPSNYLTHLSDADLTAVVAYARSVPPVDRLIPARKAGPLGAILLAMGHFDFAASLIDHRNVGSPDIPAAETPEYGQYLVSIASCRECHGEALAGGKGGFGPPQAPNLTPAGDLGAWSRDDLVRAIRTGVTPSRLVLDGEQMPWPDYAHMSDTELGAIWAYLHSLPALPGPRLADLRAASKK